MACEAGPEDMGLSGGAGRARQVPGKTAASETTSGVWVIKGVCCGMWSRFRNGERAQGRGVKGGSCPRGAQKGGSVPTEAPGTARCPRACTWPCSDPWGTRLRSGRRRAGGWFMEAAEAPPPSSDRSLGAASVLSLSPQLSEGGLGRAPDRRPLQSGPQGPAQEHIPRHTHRAEPTGPQDRRQNEPGAALQGRGQSGGQRSGCVPLRGVRHAELQAPEQPLLGAQSPATVLLDPGTGVDGHSVSRSWCPGSGGG